MVCGNLIACWIAYNVSVRSIRPFCACSAFCRPPCNLRLKEDTHQMMVDLLPSGLRGLMLASFFAAFMSTLSTYLNLSPAYFVNDFYRP
ncbi:MAG: hypothetical protein KJ739_03370 [Nitrospinae bacterium]|nr:hypothetical protein [Nitrospinota bacterium]